MEVGHQFCVRPDSSQQPSLLVRLDLAAQKQRNRSMATTVLDSSSQYEPQDQKKKMWTNKPRDMATEHTCNTALLVANLRTACGPQPHISAQQQLPSRYEAEGFVSLVLPLDAPAPFPRRCGGILVRAGSFFRRLPAYLHNPAASSKPLLHRNRTYFLSIAGSLWFGVGLKPQFV